MKKILVASTTGMGDCLWGTPALRALRKSFPDAQIDLVVNHRWASLFHGNPHINDIYQYHPDWHRQPGLGMRLIKSRYDTVLIFHANRDFKRLLLWVRRDSTWFHQAFDWLPETTRLRLDQQTHGIQRRLSLIQKLGAKPDGGKMELFFNETEKLETGDFLKKNDLVSKDFVYINVGASEPRRRWPDDRFIELTRKFLEATSFKVVLGGGPGEMTTIAQMTRRLNSPRVKHSCDLSLKGDCCLINQARLFVTCDTGPMHVGFALGVPTMALFGHYDALCTGPFELEDNVCFMVKPPSGANDPTPDNKENFFERISIALVWGKVEEALKL